MAAAVVAAVLAMGLLAWLYLPYVDHAREAMATAQRVIARVRALGSGDLDAVRLAQLRQELLHLRQDVDPLHELLVSDPLVAFAGSIPATQPQVHDATAVVNAARDLLAAGEIALGIGDRFVALAERATTEVEGHILAGLVELIATSTHDVDRIERLVEGASGSIATVSQGEATEIGRAAATIAAALEHFEPMVADYGRMDDIVPSLLGRDGRRRYLVLAQDPAELRPSGGFVGTVGIAMFERGDLVDLGFTDVYAFDLKPNVPFVEPPPGLRSHLLGPASWQLADANWSPDFPTAAQDAVRLYTLESGDGDIDGVIALTTFALDRLLAVVGPVEVPEYEVTVHAGEVTMTALAMTRGISTPSSDRKGFLDALSSAVLGRAFSLPPSRWPELTGALAVMAEQRLVQVWFKDPAAQGLVTNAPMGGAVRQDGADYLYVVEANVAPTSKYNLVVRRRTVLRVALQTDGGAHETLRLEWQNDAAEPGEPYASIRRYSTSPYGLYGAHLRILVPSASVLVEASGRSGEPVRGVESIAEDSGRLAFANYLLIPPGQAEFTYAWWSPRAAQLVDGEWCYRLTIQKQPGMAPEPLAVEISLPAGAQVTSLPPGTTLVDGVLTFAGVLTKDVELTLAYRFP